MGRRYGPLHAGVALLVLLSLACQGGSAAQGQRGGSNAPREQVLRVPATEPPTLDPGLATDHTSLDIIWQMFEGLISIDDNGTATGVQAEGWQTSDDGRTYTFVLRQGLKWSDGRPVTAGDYEYAWKRNISPATGSDYANTLYPLQNAQRIHKEGADPATLGVR